MSVDEEILWSRENTKGVFRKKVVSRIAITTRDIVIINYEGPNPIGAHTLPIEEIDDIIIMNKHRINGGHFTSYYTRVGNMRAGVGGYKGKSYEVGDLQFVNHQGMDFTFHQVPDPRGLKDLVMSLQNAIRLELER